MLGTRTMEGVRITEQEIEHSGGVEGGSREREVDKANGAKRRKRGGMAIPMVHLQMPRHEQAQL